jgi:glycosyltransferase involved in cell wall biosynthesis
MKIALDIHMLGSRAGGNETYFRQLLRGLAADKSDNQYVLFHTSSAPAPGPANDQRFSLVQVPKNSIARVCFSLPLAVRRAKPDIFHGQYVRPFIGKIKTVISIHDLAYEHFPEHFPPLQALRLRKLTPIAARSADHILTISSFCADDISQRYGVPREKITVAYPSASSDFQPRDKQVCQEHLAREYRIASPFILYVGRIQARKNLPALVKAFAKIRKQGCNAQLVIVGKRDWQFERLFASIRELGLSDAVVSPGYVVSEDLPLFYNAAELFVFPSFFEGFGLPLVESMASGVPTVTSYGSALEEVAGDGALLVDPRSVDAIAGAMRRILEDDGLRRQLVTRGLRRSAEFKSGELAAKALSVYRSLA